MSVTLNDIAKALNISRNTVSKALNGKHVSEKTRKAVTETAARMNYKSFAVSEDFRNPSGKKILLISSNSLMNISFHIYVMKGIDMEFAKYNISLVRYTISSSSPFPDLKNYIKKLEVDAIICIEFFRKELIEEILSLNLPTVFLDFPRTKIESDYPYDVVLMENINTLREYCCELIQNAGCKSFGYVGDINNCLSFYERFIGMKCAMEDNGLKYNPDCSILSDNSLPYSDIDKLSALVKRSVLPDCYICANDFIAFMLLNALNTMNIDVPKQVKVVGFENSPESDLSTPSLSTVDVKKIALGRKIASTVLYRIKHRNIQTQFIYLKSGHIQRETTDFM